MKSSPVMGVGSAEAFAVVDDGDALDGLAVGGDVEVEVPVCGELRPGSDTTRLPIAIKSGASKSYRLTVR
jgi:hypothetical protein